MSSLNQKVFPVFCNICRFLLFILSLGINGIFAKEKKIVSSSFVEKLQFLERQIALEIETSRAKGIIKGTYAAIYFNSQKILEMSDGISASTPVPLFSIAKPFTAFAVIKLAEGGYIKFHDPITKYISEFKEISFLRNEPITIKDLLYHTSGIPNSSDKLWLKLSVGSKEYNIPNQVQRAGDKFIYSNYNYRILAKLVENVSTQTLGEYLTEIFFRPLHIDNVKLENYDGASGLALAPNDLFQFANIILRSGKLGDEEFIMRKTIKNFFRRPPVSLKQNQYYGFGWFIQLDKKHISKIWHSGKGDYAYSYLKLYPKQKIVSIFSNLETKKNSELFSKMNSNLEKMLEEYIQNLEGLNMHKSFKK